MTTETTDTPKPTVDDSAEQPVTEQVDEQPDEQVDDTGDPQLKKVRSEAAKYRTQLREAETARDQLAAQIDGLRKQVIDSQVTAAGLKPAALWSTTELGDLLAEDGTVDPERVEQAIKQTRDDLGISRFSGGADQGARSNGQPSGAASWADLLRSDGK